jgi:hypothetical protein
MLYYTPIFLASYASTELNLNTYCIYNRAQKRLFNRQSRSLLQATGLPADGKSLFEFELRLELKYTPSRNITGKTDDDYKEVPSLSINEDPSEMQIERSTYLASNYVASLQSTWDNRDSKVYNLPSIPNQLILEDIVVCESALDLLKTKINRLTKSVVQCQGGMKSKLTSKQKALKNPSKEDSKSGTVSSSKKISACSIMEVTNCLKVIFKDLEFENMEFIRRVTYFVELVRRDESKDMTILMLSDELLGNNFTNYGFEDSLLEHLKKI